MGIPSYWQNEKLGSLATQITKGTTPTTAGFQYQPEGVPFIKVENIIDGQVALKSVTQFISPEAHSSLKRSQFQVGDVLFSIAGTIGKTALVDESNVPANTNQAVAIIRGVTGCFIPSFLKLQLQEAARRIQADHARGGAMNNVSLADLKGVTVSVPPLAEQKVIADKLDTLLAQVETTKARLERIPQILKRFRQSVLAAAVSGRLTEEWRTTEKAIVSGHELHKQIKDAHAAEGGHARGNASKPTVEAHDLSKDDLPECWDVAEMRDICVPGKPITYGILKPGPELDEGVPYIRVADFPGNKLNMANIKKTSVEIDQKFKRARLSKGDLLLSIRGSVGRLIKIPASLEGANITQDTARLSISPLVSTDFVYWVLLAESTQRRMKNATRGVAVRGINIGDVRALQVPLPPLAEQTEIVRRVDQLFAHADRIEQQVNNALARVNNLTQSILAKAFRGELTAQWRKDNPELISGENSAESLLERIKAERAAVAKPKRRKANA